MNMTRTDLNKTLSSIAKKFDDIINENNIERMHELARIEMNQVISPLFDNREIFAVHSGQFTVYCKTEQDMIDVIEKAIEIGYVNIESYQPKISDGTQFGSMNDPERPFGVRVTEKEEMVYGNHSEKFIELLNPVLEPVKPFVIHTYCYNGDYRLTFRSEDVAKLCHDSLIEYFRLITEHATNAGKIAPQFSVELKKENLDNFIVYINIA